MNDARVNHVRNYDAKDSMKPLEEIKSLIGRHSGILAEKYGIAVTGVFGSYVRGEKSRRAISIFWPGFCVHQPDRSGRRRTVS